mmetsp:Transcript_145903/g.406397  ORF Transcript_145903/g.406397 Transcript_145903/m.406397 type:complete len:381 (-) Transcript_145903:81-1223(-)
MGPGRAACEAGAAAAAPAAAAAAAGAAAALSGCFGLAAGAAAGTAEGDGAQGLADAGADAVVAEIKKRTHSSADKNPAPPVATHDACNSCNGQLRKNSRRLQRASSSVFSTQPEMSIPAADKETFKSRTLRPAVVGRCSRDVGSGAVGSCSAGSGGAGSRWLEAVLAIFTLLSGAVDFVAFCEPWAHSWRHGVATLWNEAPLPIVSGLVCSTSTPSINPPTRTDKRSRKELTLSGKSAWVAGGGADRRVQVALGGTGLDCNTSAARDAGIAAGGTSCTSKHSSLNATCNFRFGMLLFSSPAFLSMPTLSAPLSSPGLTLTVLASPSSVFAPALDNHLLSASSNTVGSKYTPLATTPRPLLIRLWICFSAVFPLSISSFCT